MSSTGDNVDVGETMTNDPNPSEINLVTEVGVTTEVVDNVTTDANGVVVTKKVSEDEDIIGWHDGIPCVRLPAEIEDLLAERYPDEYPDDDNRLVTAADLKDDGTDDAAVATKWDDKDTLSQLEKEMEQLSKLRMTKNTIGDDVIDMAMNDVIGALGWGTYAQFKNTVTRILTSHRADRIPFSVRTKDQQTGQMDFWLIRSFVHGVSGGEYAPGINKKSVLMSRQFSDKLRNHCRTQFNDEVQFWIFTGSYKGKQHLDISKLNQCDIDILGNVDSNDIVMVQFKKKTPEVMVGAR